VREYVLCRLALLTHLLLAKEKQRKSHQVLIINRPKKISLGTVDWEEVKRTMTMLYKSSAISRQMLATRMALRWFLKFTGRNMLTTKPARLAQRMTIVGVTASTRRVPEES